MSPLYNITLAVVFILSGWIPGVLHAQQARIRFDGNAWMVIDNGAALVIDNPSPAAIALGPGGGNISSEAENDRIQWNIGTSSGAYIIPWTSPNGVKIPLSHGITAAGTGNGHYIFSTYTDNDAINNWDNFDYRPSDVTNMGGSGILNNSDRVIDRFWIIDPENYTTAPGSNTTFFYDDAERTAPGNNIPAGTMTAQRFDPTQGEWELPGLGIDNFPTQTVTVVIVPTAVHRSWTLVTAIQPLPLEGLNFFATYEGEGARLRWEVESGTDHTAYEVQRKDETGEFEMIGELSSMASTYFDPAPLAGINHYRLQVYGQNGEINFSEVRSLDFSDLRIAVWPIPGNSDEIRIGIYGGQDQVFRMDLYDMTGRKVLSQSFRPEGLDFQEDLGLALAKGVYMLNISRTDGYSKAFRLVIESNER